jgi:hypothetical protein
LELTSVESSLTGDMDVRGALGVDDEPRNGFERIGVSFRVTGKAPAEKLREVVERAQKRSAGPASGLEFPPCRSNCGGFGALASAGADRDG